MDEHMVKERIKKHNKITKRDHKKGLIMGRYKNS
jgi:hypothetical protein